MPWKQWAYLEKVSSADFQSYLQNQAVAQFVSVAQRDTAITAPVNGMVCYITSTGQLQIYDGVAWRQPWGQPWGEVYYGTFTTPVTGITGTQLTVVTSAAFPTFAGRVYVVEFYCGAITFSNPGTGYAKVVLTDNGGAQIGGLLATVSGSPRTALVPAQARVTLPTGTFAYKVRAATSGAGTHDMNATAPGGDPGPMVFRVVDQGPLPGSTPVLLDPVADSPPDVPDIDAIEVTPHGT